MLGHTRLTHVPQLLLSVACIAYFGRIVEERWGWMRFGIYLALTTVVVSVTSALLKVTLYIVTAEAGVLYVCHGCCVLCSVSPTVVGVTSPLCAFPCLPLVGTPAHHSFAELYGTGGVIVALAVAAFNIDAAGHAPYVPLLHAVRQCHFVSLRSPTQPSRLLFVAWHRWCSCFLFFFLPSSFFPHPCSLVHLQHVPMAVVYAVLLMEHTLGMSADSKFAVISVVFSWMYLRFWDPFGDTRGDWRAEFAFRAMFPEPLRCVRFHICMRA